MSLPTKASLLANTTAIPAGTNVTAQIGQTVLGNLNVTESWATIVGVWKQSLADLLGQPGNVGVSTVSPGIIAIPGTYFIYRDAAVAFVPTWDTSIGELVGLLDGLSLQVTTLNLTLTPGVPSDSDIAALVSGTHFDAAGAVADPLAKAGQALGLVTTLAVIGLVLYLLVQAKSLRKGL
jgi:hypothetical protein